MPGKFRLTSSPSTCVMSKKTHGEPVRFISLSMLRATTSRGASSSLSSYLDMKRSPRALYSLPPCPLTASVIKNAFSFGDIFGAPPSPVYSAVG